MEYEQILKLALIVSIGLGALYFYRRINKAEPTYSNCTFVYKEGEE